MTHVHVDHVDEITRGCNRTWRRSHVDVDHVDAIARGDVHTWIQSHVEMFTRGDVHMWMQSHVGHGPCGRWNGRPVYVGGTSQAPERAFASDQRTNPEVRAGILNFGS